MSNPEAEVVSANPPEPASNSFWRKWIYPRHREGGWIGGLRRMIVHVLIIYVCMVSLIVLFQRKLIYHPSRTGRLLAADARVRHGGVHDIAVTTHDGLTLHGWHFLPSGTACSSRDECDEHLKRAKWVVLYFHGNAMDRKVREHDCDIFTRNGTDVFHFDYRGYGDNPGSPNERDIIEDAKTMWKYAVEVRGVPASKIVVFGESLGGGVATQLAAHACETGKPPAALILTGTFSSLVDAGAHHYWWIPVRWLLWDRYDSVSYAPRVTCPVLQFHGRKDRIVPVELRERLHAAFPETSESGVAKQWVEFARNGHNDVSDIELGRNIRALFQRIETSR
jgi:pimeloyl-ACP methyl ester carboxylesterase